MREKGIVKSKSDNDVRYASYGKASSDKTKKFYDGELTISLTEREGGNNAHNGDGNSALVSNNGNSNGGVGVDGNDEDPNTTNNGSRIQENGEEHTDGLEKTRKKCRKYCPIVDFLILIGFSAVVAGFVVHLKGLFQNNFT